MNLSGNVSGCLVSVPSSACRGGEKLRRHIEKTRRSSPVLRSVDSFMSCSPFYRLNAPLLRAIQVRNQCFFPWITFEGGRSASRELHGRECTGNPLSCPFFRVRYLFSLVNFDESDDRISCFRRQAWTQDTELPTVSQSLWVPFIHCRF